MHHEQRRKKGVKLERKAGPRSICSALFIKEITLRLRREQMVEAGKSAGRLGHKRDFSGVDYSDYGKKLMN